MLLDTIVRLEDIREAAGYILDYVRAKTMEDYLADPMLRHSVERNFAIIGEAVRALLRSCPEVAEQLGDASQIAAFRNRLVHDYRAVDHYLVWGFTQNNLPKLLATIEALLPTADSEKQQP
jgi:uncharacterized protein with HEPN domain